MSQTKAQLIDAVDGSIVTADLADDAVTAAKLASNAVVNASVDASAAIAGTKISPDFGSQAIATTNDSVTIGDSIIHAGDTDTKIRFSAADTVSVETGGTQRLSLSGSETRFNDTGANTDFVVEGDGNSALLYIDASTDRVCIGDNNPDNIFHVVTSDTTVAKFESGASGATGTSIRLFHNSGSPADNDTVGQIIFSGSDDGGSLTNYGTLKGAAQDVTNGSEDGEFTFHTMTAGTSSEKFRIDADGIRIQNLASGGGLTINQLTTTGNYGSLLFNSNRTGDFDVLGMIRGDWNSDSVAEIDLLAGNDTSNKDNGKIAFKTQASNAGGLAHRMLINEDGQVLIGTTTNAYAPNTNERFIVSGNAANNSRIAVLAQHNDDNPGTFIVGKTRGSGNVILGTNDDVGQLDFAGNDGNGYHVMGRIACSCSGDGNGNDNLPGVLRFFTLGASSTSVTERMRLDKDGKLQIATTTALAQLTVAATWPVAPISCDTTSSNSSAAQINFRFNDSHVGSIVSNSSSTTYNTSSDYRLKENIVSISDGITRLKTLKPLRFNFKVDKDTTVDGFLAHEVTPVVPEAITGTKDEVDENNEPVYQGIDQSKLVPLLTAALQEAVTKIEVLETKVAALEAA